VTLNPDFKVTILFETSNNSKKVQNKAILITADQQWVVHGLSNCAIYNNLQRPLPPISRSRHYLMPNISETVRDT